MTRGLADLIERAVLAVALLARGRLSVRLAALPFVATRWMSGRRDEARAYAWLAGLRREPPLSTDPNHTSSFHSANYFEKLEDASYATYIDSNARLIESVTPDRSAAICDFGCGRGVLLARLRERAYSNLTGYEISEAAVEHRADDAVRLFPGWPQIPSGAFDTVCLISVLEHISPGELQDFLSESARLARRAIVCCTPVYPQNLRDFYQRDLTHRILASRRWWDRRFAAVRFVPGPLPAQPLPFVEPFVYLRTAGEPDGVGSLRQTARLPDRSPT